MHPSALDIGKRFFDTYCTEGSVTTVVDLGSQNVNGSLKDVRPKGLNYVGVDFVPGEGVDIILDDPYQLPFDSNSVDIVVCSSVFEHSQFFWLLFLEIMRILKPNGIFYMNVPSNGYVHRYPVDCWRFYPDSGFALVDWAKRNGYLPALLESFVADKQCVSIEGDAWNDFVAVFVKEREFGKTYPARILHSFESYANGFCDDRGPDQKPSGLTDDFLIIKEKEDQLLELTQVVSEHKQQIANLSQAVAERDGQITNLNQTVAKRDGQLASLNQALAERDSQITALHASTSWRSTAPLRFVAHQLKRIKLP